MPIKIQSPSDLQRQIAAKAKALRLAENLTRRTLAEKSGVSDSSIKRFETTGEISLNSLLNIAFVLGCEQEFNLLFKESAAESIEDLQTSLRQRGRR